MSKSIAASARGGKGRRPRAAPPAAKPAEVASHAQYHSVTRRAHSLEMAEDYVEAIAELILTDGEARVVELAKRLGVSHVSVVRGVARLQRAGFVTAKPYRSIFLTDTGRKLADRVRRRHEVVVRFLIAIGVEEEVARADAEGIEHHVSADTLAAFERYVENS